MREIEPQVRVRPLRCLTIRGRSRTIVGSPSPLDRRSVCSEPRKPSGSISWSRDGVEERALVRVRAKPHSMLQPLVSERWTSGKAAQAGLDPARTRARSPRRVEDQGTADRSRRSARTPASSSGVPGTGVSSPETSARAVLRAAGGTPEGRPRPLAARRRARRVSRCDGNAWTDALGGQAPVEGERTRGEAGKHARRSRPRHASGERTTAAYNSPRAGSPASRSGSRRASTPSAGSGGRSAPRGWREPVRGLEPARPRGPRAPRRSQVNAGSPRRHRQHARAGAPGLRTPAPACGRAACRQRFRATVPAQERARRAGGEPCTRLSAPEPGQRFQHERARSVARRGSISAGAGSRARRS